MTEQSLDRYGELYGGLLLSLSDSSAFQPIGFPFEGEDVVRGNHIKPYSSLEIQKFDYWHAGSDIARSSVFVAERGIGVEGRMVGHSAEEVLRGMIHRVLTINEGVYPDARLSMYDTLNTAVFPNLQTPAMISMAVQSSQPKFILFSRDIPIYMNVFCDESSMLLIWSNEVDLDKRMRAMYGERFSVFRMKPIVNQVVVIQTYYLRKKLYRWGRKILDRLRTLNALETAITRKDKSDSDGYDLGQTGKL